MVQFTGFPMWTYLWLLVVQQGFNFFLFRNWIWPCQIPRDYSKQNKDKRSSGYLETEGRI